MVSVNPRVVPFAPVTIEMFLKAVFGNRWREALAAYFLGDPQRSANWSAYPAGTVLQAMTPLTNNYYDPSLPCPGGGRTGTDFEAIYAIVIDDYGVKVDEARVRDLLGCDPSYIIETSPGNYHAGWFIEPQSDRAWVWGLLRALYRALGAGDNLVKPTTWVRLPVGTNGKLSLGLGPGGFQVKLVHWQPDIKIKYTDWIDIEMRIGAIIPVDPRLDLDTAMPDPAEIETDLVLKVLRSRGMVLDLGHSMPFGWGFRIECPWAADHHDPRTEADYVPVKHKFKCHHGHCQDRNMGDLREWADQVVREDSGGLETLAGQEFDVVDPATVPAPPGPPAAFTAASGPVIDQWDEHAPPPWPGGVYLDNIENEIKTCAVGNGFDHGGFATAVFGAGSAAADKRITLQPFKGVKWTTPPIIWFMLIGDSGSMKSALYETAMEPVQKAHNASMAQWEIEKAQYRGQTADYRKNNPPPEMRPLLLNDATVESVQTALSHTARGVALVRDELAGVLEFDRYAQNGGGQGGRAFYLESYEAKPFTLIRIKRGGMHLTNSGLMIGGCSHPHRVKEYIKLTEDGLMQRFIKIRLTPDLEDNTDLEIDLATGLIPATLQLDMPETTKMIERLLKISGFDAYTLTIDGEAMVRETRAEGRRLARTTDLGPAFAAEARKMHGLHARVALVLHLMENPDRDVIDDDVVRRAKRFVQYAMTHSAHVYVEGGARAVQQAIGSYLLRLQPGQVTARDLMRNIWVCRHMTIKELNTAIEPLVNGGWVKPAEPYPTNRLWAVNPTLQKQFPERLASETARVAQQKEDMNQLGRYR